MRMWRCYFAAAAASLVLAACGGGAPVEQRDFSEIEQALENAGLQICESVEPSTPIEETEGERLIEVALACGVEDDATVVAVIAWPDESARDNALRRFEVQTRPPSRNHGITWALGPFTVHVSGERDDDVVERVAEAMDQLGAG
jgi:hypothetical protein